MAGVRGLPVKFRAQVHGFPSAWDEEVAAAAERRPVHQSVRLAAACPVGADAIAEAVTLQDVRQMVALERGLEEEKDEEAAVAQDAVRREPRELQVQRDVPPQVQPEPALLPGPVRLALLQEPQAPGHEGLLELGPETQASPQQAQEREERQLVPRVSPQPADVQGLQEQEQVAPLEAPAAAQLLWLRLLSRRVPLPRRFRHPRHPGDVS